MKLEKVIAWIQESDSISNLDDIIREARSRQLILDLTTPDIPPRIKETLDWIEDQAASEGMRRHGRKSGRFLSEQIQAAKNVHHFMQDMTSISRVGRESLVRMMTIRALRELAYVDDFRRREKLLYVALRCPEQVFEDMFPGVVGNKGYRKLLISVIGDKGLTIS